MSDLVVFTGGNVVPDFRGTPTESELAVHNGRILAIGAEASTLREYAGEVIDLEGGTLMPSFGEGHAHPAFGALEFQGPQIGELTSVPAIAEEVGRWARKYPEPEWIVAGSYDPSLAPRGEFDARWLDAAVPDRPVVLRAYDYHTVWCNTEALRRAGIDSRTPEPAIGTIVRRADGTPMGTLREWHACNLVLDRSGAPGPASLAQAIDDATQVYAAAGVTWLQDAWVEPELAAAYLEASRAGRLRLRTNLALRAAPESWRQQRAEFADLRHQTEQEELLSARTVKFFADGVIEGHTASLLQPYADAPHCHGETVWSPEELARAVIAFDADGFQPHIHAIGDAAVRTALDAIEAAQRTNPPRDRRPVIAHAQLVHPSDRNRFRRLGVIATMQPGWSQLDPLMTKLTIPCLGEERAALQYPMAELHESGTAMAFGSDWPVSSHCPLEGVQVAVTRRTTDGHPPDGWTPHQRLTAHTALRAYTEGVAWQAFAEHDRGVLRPGYSADLVWLSDNPASVEAMRISEITVHGTWLSGKRCV